MSEYGVVNNSCISNEFIDNREHSKYYVNKMNKKYILWVLLALVLVAGLSLAIVFSVGADDVVWYVDGTLGTDNISHGTGTGTDAFRTIQYAIDHVGAGDIIYVAAGVYDHFEIDKSIEIHGADPATTTIGTPIDGLMIHLGEDGVGNPLAEDVIIAGFRINSSEDGIRFDVDNGSSLTITGNNITAASYGIIQNGGHFDNGSTVVIAHTEIVNCAGAIYTSEVTGGSEFDIYDNYIHDTTFVGMYIGEISENSTVDIENTDVVHGHDIGIYVGVINHGSELGIEFDTLNNNHNNGVTVDNVDSSSVVWFANTEFQGNSGNGISLGSIRGGSDVEFGYNHIFQNDGNGIDIHMISGNSTVAIGGDSHENASNQISACDEGIQIDQCQSGNVTIAYNYIGGYYSGGVNYGGNSHEGIKIDSISQNANVVIDNNIITDNEGDGIADYLTGCDGHITISNNIIGAYQYDIVHNHGYYAGNIGSGISIDRVGTHGVVNISGNRIAGNGTFGIDMSTANVSGSVTINENAIGAWTYYEVSGSVYVDKFAGNEGCALYVNNVTATGSVEITGNNISENGLNSHVTAIVFASTSGNVTFDENNIGRWTLSVPGANPPGGQFTQTGHWRVVTTPGAGTVYHNGNFAGIGVSHLPGGSFTIENGSICKNTGPPISLTNNEHGACVVDIYDNLIDDNGTGSTGTTFFAIDNAFIRYNTITRHIEGLAEWYGIALASSNNNTIDHNNIGLNYDGILIDTFSRYNIIENNTIYQNANDGIILVGDSNIIIGNTITENGGLFCGIHIMGPAQNNLIRFNNIYHNNTPGCFGLNNEGDYSAQAGWNWWGVASGPHHPVTNPGGTGDNVSDNVDFTPWLGAELGSVVWALNGIGVIDGVDENGMWANIIGGSTDIYLSRYTSNPTASTFTGNIGEYVDVLTENVSGVTELEIRVYYTGADVASANEHSLKLSWWDGTQWIQCSDTGVNTTDIPSLGYSGYIWAKIRPAADANPTIPSLEQLEAASGTPFGGSVLPEHPTFNPPLIGDNTPPVISNVLYSFSDNTSITVDITWTTDESSTSQVKYWVSSFMYSPLDINFVIEHLVHLTGLSPGTTYHYQTMSIDMYGNLGVSREYTFTTPGQTPTGIFKCIDLSISPSQVIVGEPVTVIVSVTNISHATGSYTATLFINGVADAINTVNINAGGSQSISFTVTKAQVGTYSVSIGGLSGSFVVAAVTPLAEPTLPTTTPTLTSLAPVVSVVTYAPSSTVPTTQAFAPAPPATAPTSSVLSTNWIIGLITGAVVLIVIIFLLIKRAERIKRIINP